MNTKQMYPVPCKQKTIFIRLSEQEQEGNK